MSSKLDIVGSILQHKPKTVKIISTAWHNLSSNKDQLYPSQDVYQWISLTIELWYHKSTSRYICISLVLAEIIIISSKKLTCSGHDISLVRRLELYLWIVNYLYRSYSPLYVVVWYWKQLLAYHVCKTNVELKKTQNNNATHFGKYCNYILYDLIIYIYN